jgi:hypothetical protein
MPSDLADGFHHHFLPVANDYGNNTSELAEFLGSLIFNPPAKFRQARTSSIKCPGFIRARPENLAELGDSLSTKQYKT